MRDKYGSICLKEKAQKRMLSAYLHSSSTEGTYLSNNDKGNVEFCRGEKTKDTKKSKTHSDHKKRNI
jgi:hypothetical protein